MEVERIASIEIDTEGKLCVKPTSKVFDRIYLEAMQVNWDTNEGFLYSPSPSQWGYGRWFLQIINAVKQQGCNLQLSSETSWINVSEVAKNEIIDAAN